MKSIFEPLPADHDRTDKLRAMAYAYSDDPLYCGIFYQVSKPTLNEHLQDGIDHALTAREGKNPLGIEEVLQSFV